MCPKVSIIVPIYNAEKTLPACLGNLVHQTLKEIEIILVNDASTDHSLDILIDCENAFSDKVLLINCDSNSGPGGARNVGLSYARGEYIGFVDSDDLADPTMYETLYSIAKDGNYDIVDTAFFYEAENILRLMTPDSCTGTLNAKKKERLIAEGGYLWSKIFKRELFVNLIFRTNTILEDMETLMLLFLRANSLGSCKTPLYQYSATENSASSTMDPVKYHRAVANAIESVNYSVSNYFKSNNNIRLVYSDVQNAVEYAMIYLYKCGMVNAFSSRDKFPNAVVDTMMQELIALRKKYIILPFNKNSFIKEKFGKEDYDFLLNLESQI